ncbi:MAG: hypothetical protein HUJ56_01890 [Erysipelotrichaceae bacterium]|nr:hypothetical protein [Erysipelotrichaceae bacterium]
MLIMGQETHFRARLKANPETSLFLYWFSKTPSWMLSGVFPYTGDDWAVIDADRIREAIEYLKDKVKESEADIELIEKKKVLLTSIKVENVNELLETLNDLDLLYKDVKEDIQRYNYYIQDLAFIIDMFKQDENSDWELVYCCG